MIHFRSAPPIRSLAFLVILVACISFSETTGRSLRSIQETREGGNVTFDCSPSGPCVPCSGEEKSEEKYLCGETGYRIRLKCIPSGSEAKDDDKNTDGKNRWSTVENADLVFDIEGRISSRQRRLQGDSSSKQDDSNSYVTYRSCIPAVDEEKISVLGFEALMLALFMSSGLFIFFRRKRGSGGGPAGTAFTRIPTSFRF